MPIYEYECLQCGRIDEIIQKFSDKVLTKCAHCSGKLQKLVSHSSFHLKGTGWYATDYAGKSQHTSVSKNKEGKASSADANKAVDSKPEKSAEKTS